MASSTQQSFLFIYTSHFLDTQRRFLQMFGTVVLKVDHMKYENILEEIKARAGLEDLKKEEPK